MKIEEFLQPANVVVDLRASDKEAALRELAQRAASELHGDTQALLKALRERESLGSTGMGDGIAIPHIRFEGIDRPFGILARLKRPIEFDAVDGRPVDVLFLLVLPLKAKGGQLNVLACVARRLRDEETVKAIRHASWSTRPGRQMPSATKASPVAEFATVPTATQAAPMGMLRASTVPVDERAAVRQARFPELLNRTASGSEQSDRVTPSANV